MTTATSAHAARVTRREETADGTVAFHFANPADFQFRAGQASDVALLNPPETDAEGNTHAFSLASAPCTVRRGTDDATPCKVSNCDL
jgi:ferredoxin-NADP reductase